MSKTDIPEALREEVRQRAGFRCEYCQVREDLAPVTFPVDHITPASQGGPTTKDNLALGCPLCNGHKSDKTEGFDEETGQTVPLFNPRKDDWSDHFRWSDDQTEIIGLTATGRATVAVLKLNSAPRVQMRRLWLEHGVVLGIGTILTPQSF